MDIASQALSSVRENPYLCLQRALPTLLLAMSAAGLILANPTGHYSLILAVVPLVAAAVHGVHGTAVVGALTVATYVALRHELTETGSDVWLIKLAIIVLTAGVGLLLAQARVRERLLAHSRHLALTLQRGLLPQDLPETSAVEVCHRYVPADTRAGVGGDWFDVIQLSGARVALVIGDVIGHGIHAAAMMGRLRTAVHTLADLDLAPDELLTRMDDLVVRLGDREQHQELGATCLYLVYDPISRVCSVAGAGHTPPAFVRPDGSVEFPQLPEHPPLGVGGVQFESVEYTLPEGTVIALYTDGLLDLRHRHADTALDRLAAALSPAGRPLEQICDQLCADAKPKADDDVALLLARTRAVADSQVAAWEFPADPRSVGEARAAVGRQLNVWGLDEQAFATELAVSERVTNSIRYASAPIALRLIRDRVLICEVSDGSSTSPHLHHAQLLDEGGRGLYLVSQIAERWGTRYGGAGKTIWLEQSLPVQRSEPEPRQPVAVPAAAAG